MRLSDEVEISQYSQIDKINKDFSTDGKKRIFVYFVGNMRS